MTGTRKRDHFLPNRVYIRHGSYHYVSPAGQWVKLGRVGTIDHAQLAAKVNELPKFRFDRYAKDLFRVARRSASTRKIPIELTLHDIENMLECAGYRCTVTRIPFSDERMRGVRVRPWMPSIDRIDNTKGYVAGNCRIVCAYVNIALNVFGLEPLNRIVDCIRIKRQRAARASLTPADAIGRAD